MAIKFFKMMFGEKYYKKFSELQRNHVEDCFYSNFKSKAYRFGKTTITKTYVCPECGDMITIESNSIEMDCAVNSTPDTDTDIIYMGHEYNVCCKKCDGVCMFECDTLIADSVSKIISKGYITEYCCEGHLLPYDLDCQPYLVILDNDYSIRKFTEKLLEKHPEFADYVELKVKEDLNPVYNVDNGNIYICKDQLENGIYTCLYINAKFPEDFLSFESYDEIDSSVFINIKNRFLMFLGLLASSLPKVYRDEPISITYDGE